MPNSLPTARLDAATLRRRAILSCIIGSYGDRYGRKSALVLTVTMMATATGPTGLVPSYATIGLAAPALLVLCRLLQGFSTGGEWGGAASFMVEYAPAGRRAFFGSLQQVSTGLGQLCSITAAFVLNATLSQADVTSWGWRVPFLIGFALAPVGYWLRTRVAETPVFENVVTQGRLEQTPLRVAFSNYLGPIAQAFGITIIWTVASYMFFTFLPTYATSQLHMLASTAFASALIAAIVHVLLLPCFGTLADRIGRKPLMLTCAAGFLVLAYPLFSYLVTERNFHAMLTVQLCGAVLYAMINSCASAGTVRDVPDADPLHRAFRRLQRGGHDLRRICAVHCDLPDKSNRRTHRADLLRHGLCFRELAGHPSCARPHQRAIDVRKMAKDQKV